MSGGILNTKMFPFSAIYGLSDAKRALLCALVNPKIKSVLIVGVFGTAKSTLARSLQSHITGKIVVNVPLNVTEEQLFGSLNIESAIKSGLIQMEEGLMKHAHNNVLYVDDINLFDRKIISSIMDGILSETVKVERENISSEYKCKTLLIATASPFEEYLRPHFLDYFDICIPVTYPDNVKERGEIIKRNMEFSNDADSFIASFENSDRALRNLLDDARGLLPDISISREMIDVISDLCVRLGVEGYRGDLSTATTAKTLAALYGRTHVSAGDIAEAAVLCLSHRKTKELEDNEVDNELEKGELFSAYSHVAKYVIRDRTSEDVGARDFKDEGKNHIETRDENFYTPIIEDVILKIDDKFEVMDNLIKKEGSKIPGKNEITITSNKSKKSGKYIKSRVPMGKCQDLAFDASIRNAAPYQLERHNDNKGLAIILEKQDLREKIRNSHASSTFLFMVDNSGSLVIGSRMRAVKGAILSMLKAHYVKRDKVGFMTFSGNKIEVSVAPSRSVSSIQKLLEKLPVGSNTPLSSALLYINDYMDMYTRKHPEEKCNIILISDGKANVSIIEGSDPIEESLRISKNIYIPNTRWTVIDTGISSSAVDSIKEMALNLDATYITIDELKTSN